MKAAMMMTMMMVVVVAQAATDKAKFKAIAKPGRSIRLRPRSLAVVMVIGECVCVPCHRSIDPTDRPTRKEYESRD